MSDSKRESLSLEEEEEDEEEVEVVCKCDANVSEGDSVFVVFQKTLTILLTQAEIIKTSNE